MNRTLSSILLAILLIFSGFSAPKTDKKLTEKLTQLITGFDGKVGIYVRHLKKHKIVEIQADTLFPTASMIKVPILLKVFDKIDAGELKYDEKLTWYADSINYPYDGSILWSYQEGKTITLNELVSLMITYSDNHASLWLQKMATGEGINEWLNKNGFTSTRMNSRTEGRRPDWEKYGWGQTTPREMAELLVMIREGRAVSPAASEEMYRVLTRIYWNDTALSQIPPYVQAASKQGAVNQSRSEVVLVNAPSGDYVFCVITNNQADTRWEDDNAGDVLLRAVSRTLWEYFEPKHFWRPAAGFERYR